MKILRAILTYSVTIVAPCLVLMWLGMSSFERQRQALATLEAEKLSRETEKALQAAAGATLTSRAASGRKVFFIAKMLFKLGRLSSHPEQVKRGGAFAAFSREPKQFAVGSTRGSPHGLDKPRRHVSLHELPEPYPPILCRHPDTNNSDTSN